jgi:hypothetical protein
LYRNSGERSCNSAEHEILIRPLARLPPAHGITCMGDTRPFTTFQTAEVREQPGSETKVGEGVVDWAADETRIEKLSKRVDHCLQVWVVPTMKEGNVFWMADSDSLLTKVPSPPPPNTPSLLPSIMVIQGFLCKLSWVSAPHLNRSLSLPSFRHSVLKADAPVDVTPRWMCFL